MSTPITSLFIQPGTLNVGIGTSQPRAKLEVAGAIVPSSNEVYDLGSASLRWRDLYLSGNSINLGGTTITRDSTTGGIKFIDPATNQPLDSTVRNLTASNLTVLGDYVTLNTITSNTEQMVITNAGTGPALKVTQTGTNSIAEFYDDGNALALKVADGGNVGIGTALPLQKLHIFGNILASGTVAGMSFIGNATTATTLSTARNINGIAFNGSADISVNTLNALTRGTYIIGGNTTFDGSTASTWSVDATSANTASKIVARDSSGNFNANIMSATRCDVNTVQTLYIRSINTSEPLGFYSVISGTSWPTASLQLRELNLEGAGSGAVASAPSIAFHWSGRIASQIRIEPNGRIAIVDNPGTAYEAFVCGALAKSSGTFDIKHPTLPNKRLLHSFIEGPRCDLVYRGTKDLHNGKAEVNVDIECTQNLESSMTPGTFDMLCANPVVFLQNNISFDRVRGTIEGNILTITCENLMSCDSINWLVIAERKDDYIKSWDKTTVEGYLITEHEA